MEELSRRAPREGVHNEQQDKPDLSDHVAQKFMTDTFRYKEFRFPETSLGEMKVVVEHMPDLMLIARVTGKHIDGYVTYRSVGDRLVVDNKLQSSESVGKLAPEPIENSSEAQRIIEKLILEAE